MKNASPSKIVLVSSAIVLAILLALIGFSFLFPKLQHPAYQLVVIPFITFVSIFLVFYFSVERFIYRKIKLIYKNIHALKSTKEIADEKMKMSSDVIAEVNDEVITWAKERNTEIALLIKQADYRKEFLGNVSHELKTPIMSIQGYLETLSDGGIEDPTINGMYIEKALKNVDRMIMIIDDLVNISMLESGELELNFKKFDINKSCFKCYKIW
jgi:two-component system, OmpR family, phosphate regulon sensor histidine kinase PhoR